MTGVTLFFFCQILAVLSDSGGFGVERPIFDGVKETPLMSLAAFFRRGSRSRPTEARTDTKASRTASMIALQSAGRPVWTPRDYAALAREGFARNPVVYRCVRMISESAAKALCF